MQTYILYPEPTKTAKVLTPADLKSQLAAFDEAVKSETDANRKEWLDRYRIAMQRYTEGRLAEAQWWENHTSLVRPADITEEFCAEQRTALYKKYPRKYSQFNDSRDAGTAEE